MPILFFAGVTVAAAMLASPDLSLVIPPYKIEKSWAYFRNEGNCTAAAAQPSGTEILIMAYDAEEKSFSISFTSQRAFKLNDGDQRMMDIRLHRPGGLLDDGWEDVNFAVVRLPDEKAMFVSQPMDIPAARDFGEIKAVVFIDGGNTAGSFRMRDPKAAVKEMIRCAREQASKN